MVAAAFPKSMTIEEFAQIEGDGKFDLVNGVVWFVSGAAQRQGKYSARLARLLGNQAVETRMGEVYTAEFAYIIDPDTATVLCPDVSFLTSAHMLPDNDDFHPGPPDIAVEVISPSETARRVGIKVGRYLEAGTAIVWCVYPKTRQIVVHDADRASEIIGVGDTLTGGAVLPGFALPLAALFEE